MVHILYNPISNCGKDFEQTLLKAKAHFKTDEVVAKNILEIEDAKSYLENLDDTDKVVLVGGDGTLSITCNKLRGAKLKNEIYLFSAGTGNDFMREVCKDGEQLVLLNDYMENLPVVTVNGEEYLFINNVGYGIDGMVCEKGEELRAQGKSEINYTTVAIKLLLTTYKRHNAKVTVDSKVYEFKNVWMAPVMNGKFYGGGMMPCPAQNRKGDELSCCIIHDTNALQTLMIFPSIFKGEHIKHKSKVTVLKGKSIEVEFSTPQAVQIDGEVISGVTKISTKKYSTADERDTKLLSTIV